MRCMAVLSRHLSWHSYTKLQVYTKFGRFLPLKNWVPTNKDWRYKVAPVCVTNIHNKAADHRFIDSEINEKKTGKRIGKA